MEKHNAKQAYLTELNNIPDLSFRATGIATEGITDIVKGVGQFFTDKLSALGNMFSKHNDKVRQIDKKTLTLQAKELIKKARTLDKLLAKTDASEVMTLKVPTLLGLNVDLLTFTTALLGVTYNIKQNLYKELDLLDTVISKLISDSEYTSSLNYKNDFKTLAENYEVANAFLIDNLDSNKVMDTAMLNTVLPNLSSLKDVVSNLVKCDNTLTDGFLADIKEIVSTLTEKNAVLYGNLVNQDLDKVTKNSIVNVSTGLELGAKYISAATEIFYLLNESTDMARSIIITLEKNR